MITFVELTVNDASPNLYTQVAVICNHQRAVSKSHDSQMTKLSKDIDELKVANI
jgi:hypothetical protein